MVKNNKKAIWKHFSIKKNLRSDVVPLNMQMVEIINNDADKAEMFNKYFCSALGMKQEDVSIPYDVVDGNESLPSVTKKEVRQELLKLNIFISTALDYFSPKSLKGVHDDAKFSPFTKM